MIKDIITAGLVFIFLTLSKSAQLVGFDTHAAQKFAYDMGIYLSLLTFMIWAVSEVKGNRVYLWLFGVVTASMNPINLIMNDNKFGLIHASVLYLAAFAVIFLYRKYR